MKFIEIIKTAPDTWEVRNDKGVTIKTFTGATAHRQAEIYAMRQPANLLLETRGPGL